jgi:hypothetical protein
MRVAGGAGAGLKFPPVTQPSPAARVGGYPHGFFFFPTLWNSCFFFRHCAINYRLHCRHPRTHRAPLQVAAVTRVIACPHSALYHHHLSISDMIAGPLRRCSPGLQRKNRKYGSNTLIDHPIAKQLETCKSVNSTAAQTLSSFLAAPAPGLHRIGHQVNPRRRQPIRRKHFLPSSMCLHNSFNIPVQTFSS